MRDDFCAVIVTHGRPDRVITERTIRRHGYTGAIFLLIDDEDDSGPAYKKRYGDQVIVFSKKDAAEFVDVGDNDPSRGSVVYSRGVVFDVVRDLGFKNFIMLDDDYTAFCHRFDEGGFYGTWKLGNLDAIWEAMADFLEATPFYSVAMSQGGDFIGGGGGKPTIGSKRKVMNTFVCSVDKEFKFFGRSNDDVSAYTVLSRQGIPFLTFMSVQVVQVNTQAAPGGMTELYLQGGTYVKSFYTVMYAPSCAVVSTFKGTAKNKDNPEPGARIHHRITWNHTAPKIIPERYRKAQHDRKK